MRTKIPRSLGKRSSNRKYFSDPFHQMPSLHPKEHVLVEMWVSLKVVGEGEMGIGGRGELFQQGNGVHL